MAAIETPLLSVIIPMYNAQNTIKRCILSVCRENMNNIEIICVDDGSTDRSASIVEEMSKSDRRIQLIKQPNRSAGAARNCGLLQAQGKYVHFLDADDQICQGIYSREISSIQKHNADICIFQYMSYDGVTEKLRKRHCLLQHKRITSFEEDPAFFIYNMVAPWNKIYRRNWILKNNLWFDEIPRGNDRGFYFRMLAANGKIILSMNYGVIYQENNSKSLTGTNRYRYLESLFFAWKSSMDAMTNQPLHVQAMVLDCIIADLFLLLRHTPLDKREETAQKLREKFTQTDLSLISNLPFPCLWEEDMKKLFSGKSPRKNKKICSCILSTYKKWGLRGCIIKAFLLL